MLKKNNPWHFLIAIFAYCSIFLSQQIVAEKTPDTYKDKASFLKFVEQKRLFTFDIDRDTNKFPDTWFIQEGPQFQQYHSILIDDKEGSDDKHSLRIVFSGGKTSVFTAPLKLNPRFAFNLNLKLKTQNINKQNGQSLRFGLRALDKHQNILQEFSSSTNNFSDTWQNSPKLRIEKFPKGTYSCILFIELEGRHSGRSIFWIDEVKLTTSPRILFSTTKELNIFHQGEELNYKTVIEGTVKDKIYRYILTIKDFMGNIIDKKELNLVGRKEAYIFNRKINKPINQMGVYYINIKLITEGPPLAEVTEIIARKLNTDVTANEEFGILIGRPKAPFSRLILAMHTLGAPVAKLELLPKNFSFNNWALTKAFPQLDPLLLKEAPDRGFQFIGVINKIPVESAMHEQFKVNPATHLSDTFPTHSTNWGNMLDNILFKYGNVLSSWQIGDDNDILSDKQIQASKSIAKMLTEKANWMDVYLPAENASDLPPEITNLMYIPNTMSLTTLKEKLKTIQKQIPVTLELYPDNGKNRPSIIAKLIKKIILCRASLNSNNEPVAKPIFIDSLTDPVKGLMTTDYKPHSTYFATKTIIEWMKGTQFIGSFFFKNKSIENYVFKKGNMAFTVLWHQSKTSTEKFYLGDHVSKMDLMGNKEKTKPNIDHSIDIEIGDVPLILITTVPQLWETILSFKLIKTDLTASVKLQKQTLSIKNHFDKNAKFDMEVDYPSDWILEKNIFAGEINTQNTKEHTLNLSPSALSPVDTPIAVYNKLQISLPGSHHFAIIYREDKVESDITPGMKFYKSGDGLQVDIHIGISNKISKQNAFIASALFPNGEIIEALFKNVVPGTKSIHTAYIPKGLDYVGQVVELSIREHTGNKHILKSFPIKLSF